MLSIFLCDCWPSVCLLWKNVYSVFCPFFNWAVFVSWYWVVLDVYAFQTLTHCWSYRLQIFSSIQQNIFPFCQWFPLLCKSFKVYLGPICLFFSFVSFALGNRNEKYHYDLCQRVFCICCLGILLFQILHLGFNLFWAYFVYGIRKCFKVIILQVAVQFSQHRLLKRLSFLHRHKHFSEQAYVLEYLGSFYRIYTCINWFCSNTQQLGAAVHSLRSNGSLQSFSNHSLLLNSITKSIKMLLASVGHHFCLDTRHGFSWSMLVFLVCSLAINCNSCLRFPSHYPYDLNVA